tara:strand:+ start:549 stop:2132 length:1584 start_codon:yes stop_codon:yes gene_type:complete
MIFNAKNIKALKQNQKISCPGLNMWARGTKDGKQVYYLKYRLYGTQELKKIGTFTEKPVTKGKLKNILTPIEAQSKAEEIVSLAKQNINYFELKEDKDPSAGEPLRDKLKEFFEHILFTDEQRDRGVKLVWMKDKNRLTYFPEKTGKQAVRKGKQLGTARKKDGTPTKAEPSYKDWKMSRDNPDKYPEVDRDHYWAYVGVFNNWIAQGKRKYKAGSERKLLLKQIPYNKIPRQAWVDLHQDITAARSNYIANDTLQMLRVFYNWLIEPKQGNDPRMRDAENPITDALSTPSKGPMILKVEDSRGGKWHKQEPPEDIESLDDKQMNQVILAINKLLIPNPTKKADRMNNRNILLVLFRLITGARPDVAEVLKWSDISKAKGSKLLLSKGRKKFRLNIQYCNKLVFKRIKELNSQEPGHKFVFASWKADNKTEKGVSDIRDNWVKVFNEAGLKDGFKYYQLKHTAANFIFKVTQDAEYGAECLGVTIDVFMKRYLRSSNKAVLADKVELAFTEVIAQATKEEKGLKIVG